MIQEGYPPHPLHRLEHPISMMGLLHRVEHPISMMGFYSNTEGANPVPSV
ncbi:MAG: hypothetical protein P8077_01165 [Gammaproteobacteria bacterium]